MQRWPVKMAADQLSLEETSSPPKFQSLHFFCLVSNLVSSL